MEYILFNQASKKGCSATSYSNSNICLGIVKDSKMVFTDEGSLTNRSSPGVHAYISGMYLEPHRFTTSDHLDEICIDFTPIGYYHFFDRPLKKYIFCDDILNELDSELNPNFFERVFQVSDLEKRGEMIEFLLLSRLKRFEGAFIQNSYATLNKAKHCEVHKILKVLKCSERKLERHFAQHFDITPKQFLRINRFRRTLKSINSNSDKNGLTTSAYQNGFADQSHFNKEIKHFTKSSPLKLKKSLFHIDEKVLVSI